MIDLNLYMDERRAWVEEALDRILPPDSERPQVLHQAMRYSIFCGGKRLRPILCMAAAEVFCGSHEPALVPAAALELLHTYTLIHDDLPAMDNDDLRRGKPTSHKVYGEATAILAGDALLTLAFESLSFMVLGNPRLPAQLACELATAAGSRGVVGGQQEDLSSEGREPQREQLEFIHINKTAKLIQASCRMGALAAGAGDRDVNALGHFGERIGLAFQAADDLLNATSTAEQLGKAVGSDAQHKKMTYVALYGIEQARQQADRLFQEALDALKTLSKPAPRLAELAAFVIKRKS